MSVCLLKCSDSCPLTPPYPTLTCLTYPIQYAICAHFHSPYPTLVAGPSNRGSILGTNENFSLLTSKACSGCLPSSHAVRIGAVAREVNRTRSEAAHATPSNASCDECVEPYLHFRVCLYSVVLCKLIRRTPLPLYMPAILLLVPTNMTQCSLAEVHRRFGGNRILRNASTYSQATKRHLQWDRKF